MSLFLVLTLLTSCDGIPNPVVAQPGAPNGGGAIPLDVPILFSEGRELWARKKPDKLNLGLTEADCALLLQLQLNASEIVLIEKKGEVVVKVIIKIPRDAEGKALIGQFVEDFDALCGQYYSISVGFKRGTVTITKKGPKGQTEQSL